MSDNKITKKCATLLRSQIELIKMFPKEMQLDLLWMLIDYELDGKEPVIEADADGPSKLQIFWNMSKPLADTRTQKAINGSKGGLQKAKNRKSLANSSKVVASSSKTLANSSKVLANSSTPLADKDKDKEMEMELSLSSRESKKHSHDDSDNVISEPEDDSWMYNEDGSMNWDAIEEKEKAGDG